MKLTAPLIGTVQFCFDTFHMVDKSMNWLYQGPLRYAIWYVNAPVHSLLPLEIHLINIVVFFGFIIKIEHTALG